MSKVRRGRLTITAALWAVAVGGAVGAVLWGAPTPAAPAVTRAAPVSAANKARAVEQFDKAKALADQGQYQQAAVENNLALRYDPNNADAIGLRVYLQSKLAAGTHPAASTRGAGAATVPQFKLLTPQQIDILRIMEATPGDTALRGRIAPSAIEGFWQEHILPLDGSRQTHDAFRAAPFLAQMRRIRDSGDMKYIQQITITTDPVVITAFRNTIQPFILQNCATSACHGGEKAGPFHLATGAGEPVLYTNFYILNTYLTKGGNKLIDRDTPESSILWQYSIPRNLANTPHPETAEARRAPNPNDARLRGMLDWIKSLNFPRLSYGPGLEPGGAAPASAPAATRPTSSPAAAPTRPTTAP